jgi:tetratricopeptide (TPR) repeat protein
MTADADGPEHLELLALALSRPQQAVVRARAVLAADPGPWAASTAHQALGIVLREFGDVEEALAELRTARRLARATGSAQRETDVLASLGVTLTFAGRSGAGVAALGRAVGRASGAQRGRMLFLRGGVLLILGEHDDALRDLNRAVAALGGPDDRLWLARALTERAFTRLAVGSTARARDDLARAEELFTACGQQLESADAVVHRGVLALRTGDLPAALTAFDAAAVRFDALGITDTDLAVNRCAALLAAGLPADALREAQSAVEQLGRQPAKLAELLLTTATCALAAGRAPAARDHARRAAALFARQGRTWWRAHARLVELRAEAAAGAATPRLLRDAQRCAAVLAELGSPETGMARLLAGRTAVALGRTDDGERLLADAARGRGRGPALVRTLGWLAEALRADAAGDPARVQAACRRGLDVLDEHRGALGSSELLAQTTAHGAELARLGQRHALRTGRPRRLLEWSERWRASALAVPPVRPSDDEDLRAELAALRAATGGLANARARGLPTHTLQREQLRLERAVRSRSLRSGRDGRFRHPALDVAALLDDLGDRRLVEIVEVDGTLHVLVCGRGEVRRFRAGPLDRAAREIEIARFWLTRLAHGVSAVDPDEIVVTLKGIGERCASLLLGDAARHLGDGPVVVVPPGRLQAAPWSLLPELQDRPVSVAPSATTWQRALHADRPGPGAVVLARGPGLGSGGAEVPRIAPLHRDPVLLGDGTATVARLLTALDGAELAHIAAHGTFRADSPLFSALRLDDGALTVYDLEGLGRAPRRVVLSSCDSGLVAPAGADELLGLAGCLIPLGTSAIVAGLVPVNDAAVVPLMMALHRRLQAGATMAEALHTARAGTGSDPVALGAGWSFVALGPG